jgi:hypothetical protein
VRQPFPGLDQRVAHYRLAPPDALAALAEELQKAAANVILERVAARHEPTEPISMSKANSKSKAGSKDAELIDKFVSCFKRLDEMVLWYDPELSDSELVTSTEEGSRYKRWRPLRIDTPPAALETLYGVLPVPLPRLYERLVLSYRWASVDLGRYRLLANPPGPSLNGLLQKLHGDPALWQALLPAGYILFGHGPDLDYDPVCFDFRRGRSGDDCRVVKLDHEEILCYDRIKEVAVLAPTFRELVWQTIERAYQ